ncbi:hypothetical protein HDU76_008670 [Blyttiomyces sp. JEL0837]|nr:hypothetical protein HDU76_008670 [Blyttiomyces sp. JEL0837]
MPGKAQTKVQLGKNGPFVAPIGLGAMGMSEFYAGAGNEEENLKTLNHAIDIGCNFIDTADMYGSGKNEQLLAKVLKTRRSEVFICTKFAIMRGPNGEFMGVNGSPEYVKKACYASLERLGIDCIDLYYQHRVDPKTPIEDTVRAMAELVKEGKVKYLGLSEASAATIRRAHAVHPISAYQVEYSPWTLDIEKNEILNTCKELGITVVAYSPLGRGFLTGSYKTPEDFPSEDYRRFNPRFQGEAFYKNLELVESLKKVAAQKGCTVSQLTLAWVISQAPDLIIPIPGTTKAARVDENWGAKDVEITEEDEKLIRKILGEIEVAGTRYPAAGMAAVNI